MKHAIEIDYYRAVIALVEQRHFKRAAELLAVTQPSLTSRLQRLEQRLGAQLFKRDRRGVDPTAVGLALYEAALSVTRAASSAEQVVKDASDGYGQTVRVGFTQLAAQTVVVDALTAFRRRHPKLKVQLTEASSVHLERALENHGLDLAFLHPPLQTNGLSQKVIHESRGRRIRLNPETSDQDVVGYPASEAPVLMSDLFETLSCDRNGQRFHAIANTVLGAIVLSRSGFGDAMVPADFDHPIIQSAPHRDAKLIDQMLKTAIAARATDRRPLIVELFQMSSSLKPSSDVESI